MIIQCESVKTSSDKYTTNVNVHGAKSLIVSKHDVEFRQELDLFIKAAGVKAILDRIEQLRKEKMEESKDVSTSK
jgi:hypothetical protein